MHNTLKFSLAALALASTLKFSLRRRENRQNLPSNFRRAEKLAIFVSPRGFAPLEKFLRAPMLQIQKKEIARAPKRPTTLLRKMLCLAWMMVVSVRADAIAIT